MFPVSLVRDAEELYTRYHRSLFAYLLRLTGSRETAEELLQETFIRAIRAAAGYRGDAPPMSWLATIGRRLYADYCRKAGQERDRRGEVVWEALPDPAEGPEGAALRTALRGEIAAAMAALPEVQRLALLLRDADGLSYEEIADLLSLSLANVKVTIHRARKAFREAYPHRKE